MSIVPEINLVSSTLAIMSAPAESTGRERASLVTTATSILTKIVSELTEIAKSQDENGEGESLKLQSLLVEFTRAGGDPTIMVDIPSTRRQKSMGALIYRLWIRNSKDLYRNSNGETSEPVSALERNLEQCLDLMSARGFDWIKERVITRPVAATDRRLHAMFDCAIASSSLPFSLNELLKRAIKGLAPLTAQVAIKRGANIREMEGRSPMAISFNVAMKGNLNFYMTPKLQVMSLLRDAAIGQFARELLPLCPPCLPPALVGVIASYRKTDLFDNEYIGQDISFAVSGKFGLSCSTKGGKFNNAPIIMALKEGPESLMNHRDSWGKTLLTRAICKKNTELAAFLKTLGAAE